MIRDIPTVDDEKNRLFLQQPCAPADIMSAEFDMLVVDLMDTAEHNRYRCAGLSANQIGHAVTVFAMRYGDRFIVIANPVIASASKLTTSSTEGCLSIPNSPPQTVERYKWVRLQYWCPHTERFVTNKFARMDAIIVQHEMDHGKGILI